VSYRRAVALEPDEPLLHFNLTNDLFFAGRYEEALAVADRAGHSNRPPSCRLSLTGLVSMNRNPISAPLIV
jgi:hypothetical protein